MTDEIRVKNIYSRVVSQKKILEDVNKELSRQDELWGEQNHSFSEWMAILGEEYGEVCREVSEIRMAKGLGQMVEAADRLDEELIQVIAVCFRILEKTRLPDVNS